ncbi:uncharacterized protein LOC144580394 [Callithrix jacchus]
MPLLPRLLTGSAGSPLLLALPPASLAEPGEKTLEPGGSLPEGSRLQCEQGCCLSAPSSDPALEPPAGPGAEPRRRLGRVYKFLVEKAAFDNKAELHLGSTDEGLSAPSFLNWEKLADQGSQLCQAAIPSHQPYETPAGLTPLTKHRATCLARDGQEYKPPALLPRCLKGKYQQPVHSQSNLSNQ